MTALDLWIAMAIKCSLVLGAGLAAARLCRRRSASLRHWVLASTLVGAALIPVLESIVPAWPVALSVTPSNLWMAPPRAAANRPAPSSEPESRSANARSISGAGGAALLRAPSDLASNLASAAARYTPTIIAIWLGGIVVNLLILTIGLGRLKAIETRATPVTDGPWLESAERVARRYRVRRRVRLLQTDSPGLLVTWGVLRLRIALPRHASDWSEDRIETVLAHELAHVHRCDWATQVGAEILRAVYWFNPIVWVVCTRLRQESEHASDDAVLNHGMGGSEYAGHLIALARALAGNHNRPWLPAAAVARPSSLERRIRAMLNTRTNRAPAPGSVRLATIGAALLVSAALAAAQAAFSRFSGTVFDETNGFIPGATLVLTNPLNQSKYEVVTDRIGRFEFVGLPPGDYELETKVMGFATLRGTVSLRGQDAQRDLVLQIGSLQETIHVTGPSTKPRRTPDSGRPARRPDPACNAVLPGGMGGNIRAPHKLVDVKPIYPPQLYEAQVGGTVVLKARIDTEGRVASVEVQSPAHPDLNEAAMEAVRQWEFDSTILNCTKVEVPMTVNISFAPR